ncbi:unnamed protein product, partial [Ectocarpus sp. 12 AP-2014]
MPPFLTLQAQQANIKAGAAVAPRAPAAASAAGTTSKSKSPGLRRRGLLDGADDVPWKSFPSMMSSASESSARTAKAGAAAAGEAPALSVVSRSATSRFRARRELERLAASGNEDAVEALRALDSPTASSPPVGGEGGGAEGGGGGGGGLTPFTVLPVLLALVGAGYCAVNDLIPRELSWAGGGGSGDSAAAGNTKDEDESSSLSPLLRTLSRVAAFVPVASSTTTPPTSDDGDDDDVGGAPSPAEAAPIEEEQPSEGQREAGWRLWGWWRRGRSTGAAVQPGEEGELVGNSGALPEDEVVTAG